MKRILEADFSPDWDSCPELQVHWLSWKIVAAQNPSAVHTNTALIEKEFRKSPAKRKKDGI